MGNEINIQQKIQELKKTYPKYKSYSDTQIISVMREMGVITLTLEQQKSLFYSKEVTTSGDSVNFSNTKSASNAKTIKLKSGEVGIKSSDGKIYNFNKTLEIKIDAAESKLKQAEDSNGFIGSAWSWAKNTIGFGASSDNVRNLIDNERKLLAQFNNDIQKRPKIFKELTGTDYTPENLEKFIKGEIKLKSEQALDGYNEGQEVVVEITSDFVSGVVAYGTASACIVGGIAAAPFTAGASLGGVAVGIGIAAGAGAAAKVVVKGADALAGGKEYSLVQAGKDATIGAVSGAIAPITVGVGGVVANSMSKIAPKWIATTTRFAIEGGTFGGVDGATRSALDGDSLGDIAIAGLEGAAVGAVAGNVMGHGGNALAKGFKDLTVGRKAAQIVRSFENGHSKIKLNDTDKNTILYLLEQGLDLNEYSTNDIIKFLKHNGDYSSADIDLVVSFIKKFENSTSAIDMFNKFDLGENVVIKPQQLKDIIQGCKDLPADVVQTLFGDRRNFYLLISSNWSGDSFRLFTKILPESKGFQKKTLENLRHILNSCQKGKLDTYENADIQFIADIVKSLTPAEKNVFNKAGINTEKLLKDLVPKCTGFEVRINQASQSRFLKTFIEMNPKADDIISSNTFKSYLSGLEEANMPIPLKYSRQQFSNELKELLSKLPENVKTKVLEHFNINLSDNSFSGFVKVDDFNYKEFAPEFEPILKAIKSKADDFVLNNETTVSKPEVKQLLDDLIKGFPEFTSIIGKIDADHSNRIDIHILQVLSEALSHPDYNALSQSEKTMLKFSVLMHDIGKVEGQKTAHCEQSATYARSILDKFNFSQDEKEGITNLIKYHHFGEEPNTFYNYFRTPEQQKVAKILADSDYMARFKTQRPSSQLGSPLPSIAKDLQITKNISAATKYPKQTFTLRDGRKVLVAISDMRGVKYDAQASEFGWNSGKTLENTKVQFHNCDNAQKVKNILDAYINPNKDMTLSSVVTTLDKVQGNIYGKISVILSVAKGNNVVVSNSGASNGIGSKKGFKEFIKEAMNPSNAWKEYILDSFNEILALNPKVEQIALKNVAPENIPLDLIELAAEYNIPIVLLP